MEYTQHSEAPDEFHKWTGIAAIAGALRRRVWVDMGYFKWYPNFFLCFVAPPGIVSKSTTADIGMSLLRSVPGIKMGPSSITWQALITSLGESREDYLNLDGDYTPMCALTIVASELGTLLLPNDETMINVLVELWDGKDDPFRKVTKKDGEEIVVNPWVQLIGCTTPAWIAQNFTSYFLGGGFASRTLFIYAEHKRQLVPYPRKRIDAALSRLREHLVADLAEIADLQGPFLLSGEAEAWGEQWYGDHFTGNFGLQADPRSGGYFARKQTHLHKTAMVLSASRRSSLRIELEDMIDANAEITALEPNIAAVYGQMGREKITDSMATILEAVRVATRISKPLLYKSFVTRMGLQTFNECLDGLVSSGLVTLASEGGALFLCYAAQEMVRKVANRGVG